MIAALSTIKNVCGGSRERAAAMNSDQRETEGSSLAAMALLTQVRPDYWPLQGIVTAVRHEKDEMEQHLNLWRTRDSGHRARLRADATPASQLVSADIEAKK